jgi:hypothetical protein
MSRLRTPLLAVAFVALALSGVACKQGLGDRCEQNSDCSSGLVCNYNGLTTADMGRCINPNAPTTDAGTQDDTGTTPVEAGIPDTAPDQAPDDGSLSDASDTAPAVDGGDAATGSDGATDSGSTDTGAADAPVDSAAD